MATRTPAAAVAVPAVPPAPGTVAPRQDRRLRLDEILNLMVAEGLIAAVDAEKLSKLRSSRIEHPLELIAEQKWKSLIPPHRLLALD